MLICGRRLFIEQVGEKEDKRLIKLNKHSGDFNSIEDTGGHKDMVVCVSGAAAFENYF